MTGSSADISLDASQVRAVELICSARFGIVTGGPGTGKTTCLRNALDQLDASQQKYELAAPTGKAAKRVHEATGREARTVHRLLEFHPNDGWRRNRHAPIEADVVVIDESSMIDVELGAALFDAIGPGTRLVLVGDADQLPPVGPGRVFGDLVESGEVPVARLTTLHRSAQESWIARNAPAVLQGAMPDLQRRADFRFYAIEEPEHVLPKVCELIAKIIPREIDADAQVLIPQRPGVAGVEAANKLLQHALNPRKADDTYLQRGKADKSWELRIGDRVIQTKNNYTLGVFNGEVGDVLEVSKAGVVIQYLDRGAITYSLEQAGALHLAYALTVHRAQGSEFPWAVVVCHSTHTFILSRQLLYTAITRGKQGVILVGNEKGIRAALSEKRPPKRNTALIERMRGELDGEALRCSARRAQRS